MSSNLLLVDPIEFLDRYFPSPTKLLGIGPHQVRPKLAKRQSRSQVAHDLEVYLSSLCKTSNLDFRTGQGPEIVAHERPSSPPSQSTTRSPSPSVLDFQLFVVTRSSWASDPIKIDNVHADPSSSADTKDELWDWATQIFSHQYRLAVYAAFVSSTHARLFRFEPDGVTATSLFNHARNPQPLVQFFLRFASSEPGARGYDPTISPASPGEARLARRYLKDWIRTPPDSVTEDKLIPSIVRIQVPNRSGNEMDRVVIGWYSLCDPDLEGKCTRVLPVLDLRTLQVMCLKDSWREDGRFREEDILYHMNQNECRNVPEFITGGDLAEQVTTVHEWKNATRESIPRRQHHRFLTQDVGLQLETFKSSYQFLSVCRDALIGLEDAFSRCGLIHGDISPGNIMIKPDGSGFLNDWDLVTTVHGLGKVAHTETTWPYVSINRLFKPTSLGTHLDDVESFVWSLLHHALRYTAHSKVDVVQSVLDKLFNDCEEHQLYELARNKRLAILHGRIIGTDLTFLANPVFSRCISESLSLIAHRQGRPMVGPVSARDLSGYGVGNTLPRVPHEINASLLLDIWKNALAVLGRWRKNDPAVDYTKPLTEHDARTLRWLQCIVPLKAPQKSLKRLQKPEDEAKTLVKRRKTVISER